MHLGSQVLRQDAFACGVKWKRRIDSRNRVDGTRIAEIHMLGRETISSGEYSGTMEATGLSLEQISIQLQVENSSTFVKT